MKAPGSTWELHSILEEIGVGNGEIIAVSKGLHLYDYSWDLAKQRTGKLDIVIKEGNA